MLNPHLTLDAIRGRISLTDNQRETANRTGKLWPHGYDIITIEPDDPIHETWKRHVYALRGRAEDVMQLGEWDGTPMFGDPLRESSDTHLRAWRATGIPGRIREMMADAFHTSTYEKSWNNQCPLDTFMHQVLEAVRNAIEHSQKDNGRILVSLYNNTRRRVMAADILNGLGPGQEIPDLRGIAAKGAILEEGRAECYQGREQYREFIRRAKRLFLRPRNPEWETERPWDPTEYGAVCSRGKGTYGIAVTNMLEGFFQYHSIANSFRTNLFTTCQRWRREVRRKVP